MLPSLPDRFSCPEIPAAAFALAFAALFARIIPSVIPSIKPDPNVGVGIRKMRLPAAEAALKSGCAMLHPGASVRPVIVYRSCTPPSDLNRAPRRGPFPVMKYGTPLVAPYGVATAPCGLPAGLVPPTAGWAWQPAQLSKLKVGPNPLPVPSIVPLTDSVC